MKVIFFPSLEIIFTNALPIPELEPVTKTILLLKSTFDKIFGSIFDSF
jgi:hypothetical protein